MAGLRLTPEAEASVERAARWWRENRPASPALLEEELAAACALAASAPHGGRLVPRRGIAGLRRLLLPATRHHLYYLYDNLLTGAHGREHAELRERVVRLEQHVGLQPATAP